MVVVGVVMVRMKVKKNKQRNTTEWGHLLASVFAFSCFTLYLPNLVYSRLLGPNISLLLNWISIVF
jgi:uncharacterized protein (DUF983 family)